MSTRLLLISGNYSPEPTGTGKYNGEMIRWLAANGYECTVLTSYPHYPQWKIQSPYHRNRYWYKKEVTDNGKITIYRCPLYIPANPSGKKRMLMDFSFELSATTKLLQLLFTRKFDIVIAVAPAFHMGLMGVLYKKVRGAKFIFHIQDLQIEAARDLKMLSSPTLLKLLFRLEKYILQRADIISSISDGMMQKIREKAQKDIFFFPNWANISQFYPIADKYPLKTTYGFADEDKVVLYAGAIGEKQGLEAILQAAHTMREEPFIKFLICGAGPYREQLQLQAATLQLSNVRFLAPQPADTFNHFLNMADVHLVIQKASAGDLVMPSKLTTIMAVGGLALVTANENTSLHTLVKTHNAGIVVPAEDQQALNEGIRLAVSKTQTHITRNARQYALDYLSIDEIMSRFHLAMQVNAVPT
jgi:colanic acid biosynthesis glycosyl transferase WcaI